MEKKEIKTIRLNGDKGEMICPECKGHCIVATGTTVSEFDSSVIENATICSKCHGDGKLDWIENIVGKKEPQIIDFKGDIKIWGQKVLRQKVINPCLEIKSNLQQPCNL